ncbi:formate dehydrogenase accessory sulfurtransferase FdhD [Undibacterium sp.]|jgi:FdhD protein|uniref:formate dehydrogenase accessory sulfurtransferase FdhD n=1 Tax=Undibacterium sp. TaxID=1914977 RepID=UPI002C8646EE|nr:formate dehydrogenase accessory sulfurtransferase FdhD [Undibacterium sp.]HTD07111.1 formate dehydrogenase accessory sulfurtransferase FdhD [Undibacterium sp.]
MMQTDPVELPGYCEVAVVRHQLQGTDAVANQGRQATTDQVAEERPVALVFNGISHAVMMLTPQNLEDFAIGFSLSERIIDNPAQIYDMECIAAPEAGGVEIRLTIASECFIRLKDKRRQLAGRTGCGVCGLESLAALDLSMPRLSDALSITPQSLQKAFAAMQGLQEINAVTGATHAAAWADIDGNLVLLREDVGRHNALDKLIGALAAGESPRPPGFAIMSSRASYELVQKAARANMSMLATISAPTSLAISMAEQAGISLLGFVRRTGFVVYTHAQRVAAE